MAAVMDLDLNCSPPSPETAPQDHHLKHAMLRQEHTFRHQVEDLHRLYWAQKNLTDVPFWMQSDDVLYARHSMDVSHVMDLNDRENHPGVFGGSYELGKQAIGCGDEVAANLGVRGSVRRKLDHGGSVQGRPAYRPVIDLEKPATLEDDDDDVEIVCSVGFSDYANRKGSTGSSETPDSHSPVKGKTAPSGCMLIDLNIAQEDDFNVCPDPSKMFCSLLANSRTVQYGECYSNSSRAFHKGGESSIGSSKGSSVTVVTSISAPASAREVMASGPCDPQSSSKLSFVEASKYDAHLRGNIQHQHTLHNVSGMCSQGSMQIPCEVFSVRSSGGNSSSGVHKVVDREQQGETFAVISDDEMEGIDLNVSLGSIELPSTIVSSFREKHVNTDCSEKLSSSHYFAETEGQQNISSVDCPTIREHHMAASMHAKSARSQDSGIATNRSISIPETPQGHDYACPRLRSSNNGASNLLNTTSRHQADTEEDEKIAAKAAETLVSLFTNNAWIADSYCSNNQTDAQDRSDEPQISLDSFEEGVMNLEEMRDDGESVPVTAPDKDGPSCGIKLKRGRGMRDFQREILPGLVSLARHEICDDLHAIGYELRKTRSRRHPGDKCTPSTRSRLPRRCSTAWNQ